MNTDLNIFLKNIQRNWSNILIIVLIVVLVTAVFTFSQPMKYESSTKLLVVQEYNAEVDPYAASRSTQYLSSLFTKVIQSTSFFEEVMDTGFNIDDNFGSNSEKRINNWNKTVKADAISDSGIIIVNVYHKDVGQAEQIAQAVSYVLKSKNSLYHGWGNRVSIRTIERPINSQFPVKPNILFNFIFGILFGVILGAGFIYLFPESKIRLWPKRKKKINKQHIENPVMTNHPSQNIEKESEQIVEDNWSHLGEVIEKRQEREVAQEKTINDLVDRAEPKQAEDDLDHGFDRGNMDQFIK